MGYLHTGEFTETGRREMAGVRGFCWNIPLCRCSSFLILRARMQSDMAMVIDAMDILYKNKIQGFCLVTSDSDFTRLAMRLREENMFVLGMGESKTPLL